MYLRPDDTIPAVKVFCKHVHGSAFAFGNAILAAEQLGDNVLDGATAHVSETVATVGGDDVVFRGDGKFHANRDGFLLTFVCF